MSKVTKKMKPIKTLRDFIEAQLAQLHVSKLRFAKMVGISHSALNKLLSDNPPEPTVTLLWRIARATDTDMITLIGLAYPDVVIGNNLSPSARIIAQKAAHAPEHVQDLIWRLLDQ